MYLIGAASSAAAATMIVLSIAPFSSSMLATWTTVDIRCPIATYTQTRSLSLLLMIVSIATADLPVWRSPMISSRWPRPGAVKARRQLTQPGLPGVNGNQLGAQRRRQPGRPTECLTRGIGAVNAHHDL